MKFDACVPIEALCRREIDLIYRDLPRVLVPDRQSRSVEQVIVNLLVGPMVFEDKSDGWLIGRPRNPARR